MQHRLNDFDGGFELVPWDYRLGIVFSDREPDGRCRNRKQSQQKSQRQRNRESHANATYT